MWFLVNLRSGFGWWSWILTRPQTQLTRPDIVWKDLRMEIGEFSRQMKAQRSLWNVIPSFVLS